MYNQTQLRRDAAQLEIDLHDLARRVELILPERCDISTEIRSYADQVAPLIRRIHKLTTLQMSN